jgi:secreted trypsin-like serine protease
MMSANKVIRDPLWATIVGTLVAAMGMSFFMFVQSGEAAPQPVADEQPPPYASVSPKIVGGTEVTNGKYPFMAFIELYRKGKWFRDCGGTLIDRDSVLTAAHCLEKATAARVIVGRTVRSSFQGRIRWASAGFIHPRFNEKNLKYDAGVLTLRHAIMGIHPIKLATSKQNNLERPGRKATVAGWGNTIASSPWDPPLPGGPEIPDRMHEAQVPIVSDSSAEQIYDPRPETRHTRGVNYSPLLHIAAGESGKDTCHGDSGGPLFLALGPDGSGDNGDDGKNGDGDKGGSTGKYTQIGITSFGPGCAYKYFPTAYTEVNNPRIRNWILSAARR